MPPKSHHKGTKDKPSKGKAPRQQKARVVPAGGESTDDEWDTSIPQARTLEHELAVEWEKPAASRRGRRRAFHDDSDGYITIRHQDPTYSEFWTDHWCRAKYSPEPDLLLEATSKVKGAHARFLGHRFLLSRVFTHVADVIAAIPDADRQLGVVIKLCFHVSFEQVHQLQPLCELVYKGRVRIPFGEVGPFWSLYRSLKGQLGTDCDQKAIAVCPLWQEQPHTSREIYRLKSVGKRSVRTTAEFVQQLYKVESSQTSLELQLLAANQRKAEKLFGQAVRQHKSSVGTAVKRLLKQRFTQWPKEELTVEVPESFLLELFRRILIAPLPIWLAAVPQPGLYPELIKRAVEHAKLRGLQDQDATLRWDDFLDKPWIEPVPVSEQEALRLSSVVEQASGAATDACSRTFTTSSGFIQRRAAGKRGSQEKRQASLISPQASSSVSTECGRGASGQTSPLTPLSETTKKGPWLHSAPQTAPPTHPQQGVLEIALRAAAEEDVVRRNLRDTLPPTHLDIAWPPYSEWSEDRKRGASLIPANKCPIGDHWDYAPPAWHLVSQHLELRRTILPSLLPNNWVLYGSSLVPGPFYHPFTCQANHIGPLGQVELCATQRTDLATRPVDYLAIREDDPRQFPGYPTHPQYQQKQPPVRPAALTAVRRHEQRLLPNFARSSVDIPQLLPQIPLPQHPVRPEAVAQPAKSEPLPIAPNQLLFVQQQSPDGAGPPKTQFLVLKPVPKDNAAESAPQVSSTGESAAAADLPPPPPPEGVALPQLVRLPQEPIPPPELRQFLGPEQEQPLALVRPRTPSPTDGSEESFAVLGREQQPSEEPQGHGTAATEEEPPFDARDLPPIPLPPPVPPPRVGHPNLPPVLVQPPAENYAALMQESPRRE